MGKITDINVRIADVSFVVRACALIENEGKILFQKKINDKYWALPGGKIEVLETGESTVIREVSEEIGIKKAKVDKFLNFTETFFEFDSKKFHQFILTYKVVLDKDEEIMQNDFMEGKEFGKNIIYQWFSIGDLKTQPIKPDFLAEQIINNLDKVSFTSYDEIKNNN